MWVSLNVIKFNRNFEAEPTYSFVTDGFSCNKVTAYYSQVVVNICQSLPEGRNALNFAGVF